MMGSDGWGMGWGMGGFGPLLLILIVGGAIYYFARMRPSDRPFGPSPREILERRYASGEITKEQYDQMKDDLQKP
jgi:putative membrane protein